MSLLETEWRERECVSQRVTVSTTLTVVERVSSTVDSLPETPSQSGRESNCGRETVWRESVWERESPTVWIERVSEKRESGR